MVQVDAPPTHGPQIAVGNGSVDSEAITEESISSGGVDQPPTATEEPLAPFTPPPDTLLLDGDQPNLPGAPPHAGDRVDAMAWQTDKTRQIRQIVMVAMLSVASLCVTAILFIWFVQSQSDADAIDSDSVAQTESDSGDSSTSKPEAQPTDPEISNDPAAPNEDKDVAEPDEPSSSTLAGDSGAPSDPGPDPKSLPPVQTAATENGVPEPLIPDGLIPPSIIPEADSVIPSSLLPQSPLDGLGGDDRQPDQEDPNEATLQDLPAGLREYLDFLPKTGSTAKPTLEAPASIEQFRIDAAEQEDAFGLSAPIPLNLKADLAIRLAFQSNGMPLDEFVLLVAQVTNIPIDIDWVSFDLAGRDLRQVTRPTSKKSAKEWLDFVADQIDGEVRQEKFLVKLTLAEPEFSQAIDQLCNLDDFGTEKQSAQQIIEQFVTTPIQQEADSADQPQQVPDDTEDPEDTESLVPESDPREIQYLRVLATEVLRHLRGIPCKLSESTLRRWTSLDETIQADWPLVAGGERVPQVDTPIALAGFLRRITKQNDSACLINWPDVTRRGLRPGTLVLPVRRGAAGETLADLLDDYSLEARQIDSAHWWIGARATYDRLPIVLASPPLGQNRDVYLGQVRQIAISTGNLQARIAYDRQSDRALMFLPRYLARQLTKLDGGIARR